MSFVKTFKNTVSRNAMFPLIKEVSIKFYSVKVWEGEVKFYCGKRYFYICMHKQDPIIEQAHNIDDPPKIPLCCGDLFLYGVFVG